MRSISLETNDDMLRERAEFLSWPLILFITEIFPYIPITCSLTVKLRLIFTLQALPESCVAMMMYFGFSQIKLCVAFILDSVSWLQKRLFSQSFDLFQLALTDKKDLLHHLCYCALAWPALSALCPSAVTEFTESESTKNRTQPA